MVQLKKLGYATFSNRAIILTSCTKSNRNFIIISIYLKQSTTVVQSEQHFVNYCRKFGRKIRQYL